MGTNNHDPKSRPVYSSGYSKQALLPADGRYSRVVSSVIVAPSLTSRNCKEDKITENYEILLSVSSRLIDLQQTVHRRDWETLR